MSQARQPQGAAPAGVNSSQQARRAFVSALSRACARIAFGLGRAGDVARVVVTHI